jgi:hypothetical protein
MAVAGKITVTHVVREKDHDIWPGGIGPVCQTGTNDKSNEDRLQILERVLNKFWGIHNGTMEGISSWANTCNE